MNDEKAIRVLADIKLKASEAGEHEKVAALGIAIDSIRKQSADFKILFEAIQELSKVMKEIAGRLAEEHALAIDYRVVERHIGEIGARLAALAAQRRGRSDDEPAK